jgi:hypothetical protein
VRRPPQLAERFTASDAMIKPEEYRARARECELRADQVHDPEVKQQFPELARQWRHMAAQWIELLAERGR